MLSIVVVWYDKDVKFMPTLGKSLPEWAEWVFVKSVQGGTNTEVKRIKNVVQADYNYEGDFDFTKSKNFAKQFATKEWILWLDDDEHLDILQHDYIKDVLESVPENVGGLFCTQYSWLQGLADGDTNARSATATVRMSRNIPPIKWEWGIHDVLENSIVESGYQILDTNIRILHDGWVIPASEMKDRLERNLVKIWKRPYLIDVAYDRYIQYIKDTAYTIKQMEQ